MENLKYTLVSITGGKKVKKVVSANYKPIFGGKWVKTIT
jgi:hypothetical protein